MCSTGCWQNLVGEVRRRAALACLAMSWACVGPSDPQADPFLRELARATEQRPFEARLAIDVDHAGCAADDAPRCAPLPRPGTPGFTRLADASHHVLEAGRSGAPANARAQGLVELLWHEGGAGKSLARAIERLGAAVREDSSAAALSDLAVAHLLRADGRGTPFDIVEALDLIERAVLADPASGVVRFNRALVLERFSLWPEVEEAWEAYLRLDDRSPWADEARGRLSGARGRMAASEADPARIVRAAAAAGDSAALVAAAGSYTQAAREIGYDEVLPRWGRAWLTGDTATAHASLRTARWLGAPLVDRSLADAVARVESGENRQRRAEAHRLYGEGRALYDLGEVDASVRQFEAAARTVGDPSDPLALWAETWAGTSEFIALRYERSLSHTRRVAAYRERLPDWPALTGRASWLEGMVHTRRAQPQRSLRRFEEGSRDFSMARETANAAFVLALTAEAFRVLGRPEESWGTLFRALDGLGQGSVPHRLHGALVLGADGADRLGRHHAALALQSAGVRVATPIYLGAEALERRARMHARLGRPDRARSDLANARARLADVPQEGNRRIGGAAIQFTEATLHLPGSPRAAAELLDSVVAFDRSTRSGIRIADALRLRATANMLAGEILAAEADLDHALGEVERVAADVRRGDDAATVGAAAQSIARDLAALRLYRHADTIGAMFAHERGRRLTLGISRPTALGDGARRLMERIPQDLVVLKYAVLEDAAVLWAIGREGIRFESLGDRAHLEASVPRFVEAITSERTAAVDSTARVLFSALLPESLLPDLHGKRIVVIPDGFLGGLPFAALRNPDSGAWAAELWPLTVVPDLDLLLESLEAARRPRPTKALLVGEPALDRELLPRFAPLPGARREVHDIGTLYSEATIIEGSGATSRALIRDVRGKGVLHFAGHAVFDPDVPGTSRLVLAGSGEPADFVYATEITTWPLDDLELVVLSACSSVTPSRSEAGSFWGLAQPFLIAGAGSVLGSLWEIGDEGARVLTTRFHEEWLRGRDPGAALQQAQLSLIHDDEGLHASPRLWAAVQVVGFSY